MEIILQTPEQVNTIKLALEVLYKLQTCDLFSAFDLALSHVLALKGISVYSSESQIPKLINDLMNEIGRPVSVYSENGALTAQLAKEMLQVLNNNEDYENISNTEKIIVK